MRSGLLIVRRGPPAFAICSTRIVSRGGLAAEAKPAGLVGQNPPADSEGAFRTIAPGTRQGRFHVPPVFKFIQDSRPMPTRPCQRLRRAVPATVSAWPRPPRCESPCR